MGDAELLRGRDAMMLCEMFVAFQGEGETLGVESVFVRLHGCPIQCSWCDTPYTWNGTERGTRIGEADLAANVIQLARASYVDNVVVTGGEPGINKNLAAMVGALVAAGLTVEIETTGMVPMPAGLAMRGVRFNVSPKLASANARMSVSANIVAQWLAHEPSVLKFVVDDEQDMDEALQLVNKLDVDRRRVYLMPEATTRAELHTAQAALLKMAAGTGFRVTTRMHVLAHDGERRT
jgi:organic radical activating enzyme